MSVSLRSSGADILERVVKSKPRFELLGRDNGPQDGTFQRAVAHVYDWQFRGIKHFYTQLFELMCIADEENLTRLGAAFPNHALAFRRWRQSTSDREFFESHGYFLP